MASLCAQSCFNLALRQNGDPLTYVCSFGFPSNQAEQGILRQADGSEGKTTGNEARVGAPFCAFARVRFFDDVSDYIVRALRLPDAETIDWLLAAGSQSRMRIPQIPFAYFHDSLGGKKKLKATMQVHFFGIPCFGF